MNLSVDNLTEYLALVTAVSVAAERLVEIVKTILPENLIVVNSDAAKERRRKTVIQLISLAASTLTGLLLGFLDVINDLGIAFTAGLLASGGSSLWNSLLGWTKGLKDISQTEGQQRRLAMKK